MKSKSAQTLTTQSGYLLSLWGVLWVMSSHRSVSQLSLCQERQESTPSGPVGGDGRGCEMRCSSSSVWVRAVLACPLVACGSSLLSLCCPCTASGGGMRGSVCSVGVQLCGVWLYQTLNLKLRNLPEQSDPRSEQSDPSLQFLRP